MDISILKKLFYKFDLNQPRDSHRIELVFSSNTHSVSISDFELLKVLGKGSYGKVLLTRHLKTKKLYAMKIIKKELIIN